MSEYIYDEAGTIEDETLGNGHRVYHLGMVRREEIVRCRDCKHLVAHGAGCEYWDYCDVDSTDGFCAWAERKE